MAPLKVSIILPVYNMERYLPECLDDIVGQTYDNLDIVCIDDGSTDNSLSILREYAQKDERIRVAHQANMGAGTARNVGLATAAGDYLLFLDADDRFEPDMVEKALRRIEETDAELVVFRSDVLNSARKAYFPDPSTINVDLLPAEEPFAGTDIKSDAFHLFIGWAWDKLYRTEYIRRIGLQFQEQRTTNDAFFVFCSVLRAERIATLDDICVHHFQNLRSLSTSREQSWWCAYDALKAIERQLHKWGLYERFERDFVNYALSFSLWQLETLRGNAQLLFCQSLSEHWLKSLGILGHSADYFYSSEEYEKCIRIYERRYFAETVEAAPSPAPTAVHICMICDDNYIFQTATAITSMVETKAPENTYEINIICASLTNENEQVFQRFNSDSVHIHIIRQDANRFAHLHTFAEGAFCVASVAALLKFVIPELITNTDKVLYLDGDIIVRRDLSELYNHCLEGFYCGAVIDSGTMYVRNDFINSVDAYFNSGVMLLNLKRMRADCISEKLIDTKRNSSDSNLMDQNILNVVFNKAVRTLPVKYNFLPVNLIRSHKKWTLSQLNALYGTDYGFETDLFKDAVIVHYSSKDKPWKDRTVPMAEHWYYYYVKAPIDHALAEDLVERKDCDEPIVSVIMPIYNTDRYLRDAINSILNQTFRSIELICIDDGSTDRSYQVAEEIQKRDDRVKLYRHKNQGQGAERNFGMQVARGKYIYFMDSDDILDKKCLEWSVFTAELQNLDYLMFDGTSFYETSHLEKEYPQYRELYRKNAFHGVCVEGLDFFTELVESGDFCISPCMRLYRRDFLLDHQIFFPEGILLEDNLFVFRVSVAASTAGWLPCDFYRRYVRQESSMTGAIDVEKSKKRFNAYVITVSEILKYLATADCSDSVERACMEVCRNLLRSAHRTLSDHPDKEWRENKQRLINGLSAAISPKICSGNRGGIAHFDTLASDLIRHEEVVNRHEEVINRHNDSINHHWEIQKWHEERLCALEAQENRRPWKRLKRFIKRLLGRG